MTIQPSGRVVRFTGWLLAAAVLIVMLSAGNAGVLQAAGGVIAPFALTPLGTFDGGGSEIVSYDAASQRMFITNSGNNTLDIVDIADPTNPTLVTALAMAPYGGGINSVTVFAGIVAAAVAADPTQDPGKVVFFDVDGAYLNDVTVGALPDMVTFTPDGQTVVVANEGEPDSDYVVDPEGSVSIIDVSGGVAAATVTSVGFADFNVGGPRHDEFDPAIRIFGPGATIAQDLEPEYVAVSADSTTAWITLQENNALAKIDLTTAYVDALVALGTKDHSLLVNQLDPSDRDGADGDESIRFQTGPVRGFYMPDAIAAFSAGGDTYVVTANEGDARDYDGYSEEERIKDLDLDPTAFPNAATLQEDANFGRLRTTSANGDIDNDGDYDELYSYGARSFSIWNADGELVYDSAAEMEYVTSVIVKDLFNSQGDAGSFDSRSDDKGPEPEALAIGHIDGRTYAFIGLERTGGVMVYDVTNPANARFITYQREPVSDVSPEGMQFVDAADSPNGQPLLLVANEVSGTTTIYGITTQPLGNVFPALYSFERCSFFTGTPECVTTLMTLFANGTYTTEDGDAGKWLAYSATGTMAFLSSQGPCYDGYSGRLLAGRLNVAAGERVCFDGSQNRGTWSAHFLGKAAATAVPAISGDPVALFDIEICWLGDIGCEDNPFGYPDVLTAFADGTAVSDLGSAGVWLYNRSADSAAFLTSDPCAPVFIGRDLNGAFDFEGKMYCQDGSGENGGFGANRLTR